MSIEAQSNSCRVYEEKQPLPLQSSKEDSLTSTLVGNEGVDPDNPKWVHGSIDYLDRAMELLESREKELAEVRNELQLTRMELDRAKVELKMLKSRSEGVIYKGATTMKVDEGKDPFVSQCKNSEKMLIEGERLSSIDTYSAFEDVSKAFDLENVFRQGLVDVGCKVQISRPVKVEKNLRMAGFCINVSLSPNGIIAIYSCMKTSFNSEYIPGDRCNIVELTDLIRNDRQVEVEVEEQSSVAFYDDKLILLTSHAPLREGNVVDMFRNPSVSMLKEIGTVKNIYYHTDTSLLHKIRLLYYFSPDGLYQYNVDAKENARLNVHYEIDSIACMTGIDIDVKCVFKALRSHSFACSLNSDNSVSSILKCKGHSAFDLTNVLPSHSAPNDISRAVKKIGDSLYIDGDCKLDLYGLVRFEQGYSMVRLYKDVFLMPDGRTSSWVLVRIVVP